MRNRVAVVLTLLVAAAAGVARADRFEEPPERLTFAVFPMQLGLWRGQQHAPFADNILEILKLDDYLSRSYYAPDGAQAGVYVGYWKSQRQGGAIHSPQNCLPGAGWEPESQGRLALTDTRSGGQGTVEVNRFVIRKGLDRQMVLYWYQSHGRVVASEYWSKIYLVSDAVRKNRTDAALVRIIVPIDRAAADGEQIAERQAARFAEELLAALPAFVPE